MLLWILAYEWSYFSFTPNEYGEAAQDKKIVYWSERVYSKGKFVALSGPVHRYLCCFVL